MNGGWATSSKYTTYKKIAELDKETEGDKVPGTEKNTGLLKYMKNKDDEIEITEDSKNYILGPFVIDSNANSYDTYKVYTNKKTSDANAIDATVYNTEKSGSKYTFYLKVEKSKFSTDEYIKSVKVKAHKTVTTTYKKKVTAESYYKPTNEHSDGTWGSTKTKEYKGVSVSDWLYDYETGNWYQSVYVNKEYEKEFTSNEDTAELIEWKYQYGSLQIKKVDEDTLNPIQGIKFKVECSENNYSKEVETDSKGETEKLTNLKNGNYKITELADDEHYGYTVMSEETIKINPGMNKYETIKNEKQTGNLHIEKKDYNKQTTLLKGISFKIKNNDGEYIIATDSSGEYKGEKVTGTISLTNMTLTTKPEEATIFTTYDNGEINILNMLTGDYYLEETSVGNNFGYADPSDAKDKSDGFEKYITYDYTTTDKEGNEIKQDGEGNDIPFTINRQTSEDTEVASNSSNIQYCNNLNVYNKKKYIKLSGYAWEDMYYGKQSNRNNVYQGGDLTDENGNSIADNDKRLNYVPVRLVKTDGKTIEIMTNKDGEFTFGDYDKNPNTPKILIEDIEKGAYIQFYYNGLNYQTVELNCIDEKGNKVKNGNTAREFKVSKKGVETNLRDSYNDKYGQVENNKTIKEDGTDGFKFNYNYNADTYSSTLNYGSQAKYGYEGAKYPILTSYSNTEHSDEFCMTARTETNIDSEIDEKGREKAKPGYRLLGQNKTIDEILETGADTIENINLGLYEREPPDLAIAQDIDKVDLKINGYSHTYKYANRFKNEYTNDIDKDKYPDGIYNVGIKFGTKYGSESYTRTVYESDCKSAVDNKLEAYVTYKIAINNQASELNARVNSLLEYYDSKYYEIEGAYLDENCTKKIHHEELGNVNNEYAKVRIDTYDKNNNVDLRIGTTKGDTEYVYVKFEITNIGAIFFDASGNKLTNEIILRTYAEINSYSTFDKNGKIYAGIDKDSNPGNFNIEAEKEEDKQLEDDNDWAPSLIITADKARTISGTVFLDESILEKVTSSSDIYTRNGDGIYQDGTKQDEIAEKTISGVKVELYEIKKDKEGNIIYDENGNVARSDTPSGTTTYDNGQNGGTGNNGYFKISDFIPGDYVIVYTWGNKTYIQGDSNNPINVNDYKGTIYNEATRETYEDWYRNQPVEQEWRNIRYSDATDDYGKRKEFDEYEVSENSTNTSEMNSMTPMMKFGVEYADDIEYYTGSSTLDDEQNNRLTFNIPYVDFGITERARQQIDISKKVKTVKITLTNGQTIIDAKVKEELDGNGKPKQDENGNVIYQLEEPVKGLTYIGPSKNNIPKNGYLKAEMDNELIQGSTIEIGYEIIVKNNSEVDYDSENYYKYGKLADNERTEDNIIKSAPTGVYDYLDKSMVMNKENEKNSEWTVIEQIDYENTIKDYETGKTTIENYFSYIKNLKVQDENGKENTVDITGYTSSYEEYYSEINEWSTEAIKKAREKRLADKTILYNKHLEDELEPGKSNTASLYATKVLANSDEIDLNNDIEIIQVKRTTKTGRKVTPINSILYDKGETVTVTPATGENRNYTTIILLAISLFTILGTGIVFIKKKILG